MPKRATNALTLLSVVVCVGSAMLVGRSFFRVDALTVPMGQQNSGGASTVNGTLMLSHGPLPQQFRFWSPPIAASREVHDVIWRRLGGVRWLGIGWGSIGYPPHSQQFIILPLWLLPLLTAIGPVRWWRKRRRGGGRGFSVDAAAARSAV